MLTGVNDAPTAASVLATGAVDYLLKPVELVELQQAIERALHRRELEIDRRTVERMIKDEVAARTEELEREALVRGDVRRSGRSIGERHGSEGRLPARAFAASFSILAASIAEELRLDKDTIAQVRVAARIHDIGKIGIQEAVLNKPGPLTPEEFDDVKEHVRIGVDILAPLKHSGSAIDYAADHHEHWDGQRYPRGKAGESISIGGRIPAAADAYDALTSTRAYRAAHRPRETVDYLAARAGDLLDPWKSTKR